MCARTWFLQIFFAYYFLQFLTYAHRVFRNICAWTAMLGVFVNCWVLNWPKGKILNHGNIVKNLQIWFQFNITWRQIKPLKFLNCRPWILRVRKTMLRFIFVHRWAIFAKKISVNFFGIWEFTFNAKSKLRLIQFQSTKLPLPYSIVLLILPWADISGIKLWRNASVWI